MKIRTENTNSKFFAKVNNTDYQAGLLVTMTPEARRIVALLDEEASAIRQEANV